MTFAAEPVPAWLSVSRETESTLHELCRLVEKWNPAINLVSKGELASLWKRHIVDSAQLFAFAPKSTLRWCDLGSGGGFPGLVIAILAKQMLPEMEVVLVEADRRKSVFLSEAARQLQVKARAVSMRIENLEPLNADILSARALGPLNALCGFAFKHLRPGGAAIFPKGSGYEAEIVAARQNWDFSIAKQTSHTDSKASVLILRDVRHV